MTPDAFARIMDRAYLRMRPWSEQDIAETIARPHIHFLSRKTGGLIAQIVADECEILALATDPDAQRRGIASSLLTELISNATDAGAVRILLEVAEGNTAARAFYAARGFAPIGTRRAYYTLRNGSKDNAVLLSRAVARGQPDDAPTSQGPTTKSG